MSDGRFLTMCVAILAAILVCCYGVISLESEAHMSPNDSVATAIFAGTGGSE